MGPKDMSSPGICKSTSKYFSILNFYLKGDLKICKYSLDHVNNHLTSERCFLITSICIYNLIDVKFFKFHRLVTNEKEEQR